MDPILLKAIYVVVIAAAGLIGGFMPARVAGGQHGNGLALGNAFAGGVFLGAGLLHLLPDGGENFNAALGDVDFPLAVLGMGIGILLILAFDQAARRDGSDPGIDEPQPRGRALILFLVLSIHSVIAGAALGIESQAAAGLAIFIAIIAHKGAAGFALGVALATEGGLAARARRMIVAFSLMTPLGVVLGTALMQVFTGPDHFIWEAVFDSLAAGTFIYVAMSEILPETFSQPVARWAKLVLVAAGFALMALIALWA